MPYPLEQYFNSVTVWTLHPHLRGFFRHTNAGHSCVLHPLDGLPYAKPVGLRFSPSTLPLTTEPSCTGRPKERNPVPPNTPLRR